MTTTDRVPLPDDRLDEAFLPLSGLLPMLLPDLPDLVDEEAGVRARVTGCEIDTPVELDIVVTDQGRVVLGGVPPLYHLETSWLPVFHQVRLTAVRGVSGESEQEGTEVEAADEEGAGP